MEEDDPRLLNAAEFQAKQAASASAASGPQSWPAPPAMPQYVPQHSFIGTPAPPVRKPVPTTPLAEVRGRAEALRQSLATSFPKAPEVKPELEGQEREVAEKAARSFEPSNREILNAINMMRENMVVRDDIRADIVEALQPVNARLDSVDAKTTQALNETKTLHERLQTQEAGRALDVTRMSGLEEQVTEIKRQLSSGASASAAGRPSRDPNDPAYQRLAFIGFPEDTADAVRVKSIEDFMKQKLKDTRYVYVDHFDEKNSFVHFGTTKAASKVFEKIKGDKAKYKLIDFGGVTVKPALASIDRSRNWALREAERLIKNDPKLSGRNLEVKRAEGRGVYVANVPAFLQKERFGRTGTFAGEFVHLKLP